MFDVLIEEMKKFLKELEEKKNKYLEEINQSFKENKEKQPKR